jgi:hypothetical protein
MDGGREREVGGGGGRGVIEWGNKILKFSKYKYKQYNKQ